MTAPFPTRELRTRLDRLLRDFSYMTAELPRTMFKPPSDPREVLDVLSRLDCDLANVRVLIEDLHAHVILLLDVAGEDYQAMKGKEAEQWQTSAS